jgi:hypothetical protein
MEKTTSKRAGKPKAPVPKERRGADKWDAPEPLHKEKFEQLLDDAIGAKKKAS